VRRVPCLALALPLAAQAPLPEPAPGVLPGPLQAVPAGTPSLLALPLRVDVGSLLPQLEALVPRTPPVVEQWTEIAGKPRTYFRCNLYREPLHIRFRDQRVVVGVVVNFGMDVGVRTVGQHFTVMGSCGRAPEAPRRALIEVDTRWAVTPDWRLELREPQATVTPLNTCQITFLGLDITQDVTAGMQAQVMAAIGQLDALLRTSDLLRKKAAAAWTQAMDPVELRPDAWLLLRPEKLRLGPVRGQGQTVVVTPELQARPLLVVGSKPLPEPRPLPDLEGALDLPPGFQVRAEAELEYAAASRQLNEALSGKRFDTERGPLEVKRAAVAGREGKALMTLQVTGALEATLTFLGRPVVTAEGLQLADLDFTVESAGWLTRSAAWLFKSRIRRSLQEKSTLLLGQQFQALTALAHQQLNRTLAPGLELKGQLREFRLESVLAGPQSFRLVARLEGEAALDLR